MKHILLFVLFILNNNLNAQVKRPLNDADKAALEGIIIEKYYVNTNEAMNIDGGALPANAVTYRIYADLKPGYTMQAVYGVIDHPLFIKTTTSFYNNTMSGAGSGDLIDVKKITNSSAAFDSYLTIGSASEGYFGIPLADDKDGSLLKINSFTKADGLMAGKIKPVTFFGITPSFFSKENKENTFATDNGSWAVFGGVKTITDDNKILIAQLTTDGILSFELNVQIGTPTGGSVNYVARNAMNEEILFSSLVH